MNQKFYESLVTRAKAEPKTVAMPEATNEKMLTAARAVFDQGIAVPLLIGDPDEIKSAAYQCGVSLDGLTIVDHTLAENHDETVTKYLAVNDMFSEKSLRRKAKDRLNYAVMMVATGQADSAFAGIDYTTGDVVLAAQAFVGLKADTHSVSSVGIMDIPGFVGSEETMLAFADCGVCAQPDPETLADIAITSCDTVKALMGWEPRVAMVSFSTDGSAEHAMIDQVREAVKIANTRRPDLKIDGEFQLDAAVSPKVAAKKVRRESPVAGQANIIVFPDLNAGNIAVKIIQLMAKGDAVGPILQGFAKPIADCSRSASVDELVGNIAILVARAQSEG